MSKQVNNTPFADLLEEITTEILLRVDWISIFTCKRVSKEWNSIINTPNFGRLHNQHSKSHPSLLSFYCRKVYCLTSSMSCESDRPSYKLRHIPFLTLLDNEINSLFVGFSNQLACILDYNSDNILLFDLFTHQSSALPPIDDEFGLKEINCYGFGYDRVADEHKLVVFGVKKGRSVSFVYNVEKGCWNSIAAGPSCPYQTTSRITGVFFNGALHWIVQAGQLVSTMIWAIDVHTYRWVQIPLPHTSIVYTEEEHLTVLEIDGKLCLCFCCMEYDRYRVWVMKEYGNGEYWTLLVIINHVRFDLSITPLVVHQDADGTKFVLLAVQEFLLMQFYWYDCENQKTDGIERLRLEDGSIVPQESGYHKLLN